MILLDPANLPDNVALLWGGGGGGVPLPTDLHNAPLIQQHKHTLQLRIFDKTVYLIPLLICI